VESTITRKGRAAIPKAVRERLKLKPGDKIRFFYNPDGSVAILPVLPITALKGIVPRPSRPVTIEDMNEAIAAGAAGEMLPDLEP
jgi:AbrB family looped-hinge helix DNA binding protein